MSQAVRWHDLAVDEIERHFNPRVAVADAADRITAWTARSQALADSIVINRDVRYGPGMCLRQNLQSPVVEEIVFG